MTNPPTTLSHKTTTRTVLDLKNLYQHGNLNLEPGFQRQSVWTERDRAKLVDSIWKNFPVPAIFLYKREDRGDLVFDVIDGKQRLESIFMFMGAMRGRFPVRMQLPESESLTWVDWRRLVGKGLHHRITGYELPVIEVDGEIGEIIEVFVLINSTGKALTRQERRHARYYKSPFLKEASRLATRFEQYLRNDGIFSAGQISRMKHVEFMCELMLSLERGDVLNKKTALDQVMRTKSLDGRELRKSAQMVTTTMNRIRKMFPHLKSIRLRQVTDFYTLAVLIGKFEREGLILTDRRRNRLAWDLLVAFTKKVDEIRDLQRKIKGARPGQELYRDYLATVLQATDELSQRRRREEILSGVLRSVFARKDSQRGFTPEQRRIIWNGSANRACAHRGCGKRLTWDDFTVDHIKPHSKGGQSHLDNAALMCRAHNSSKGNRGHTNVRAT